MIKALIINVNKPSVIIFKGIANTIKIGLIMKFIKVRIKAAINAISGDSIYIQSFIIVERMINDIQLAIIEIVKFFKLYPPIFSQYLFP